MDRETFMAKMPEIMEKAGCIGHFFDDEDWYTGYDDIGIYPDDTICIAGDKTLIKVDDIEEIKYRRSNDEEDQNFIFFQLKDMGLFYYTSLFEYELYLRGRNYKNISAIFSILCSWDRSSDFVISSKGKLLAYLGDDTEIIIPSTVSAIGERFCEFSGEEMPKLKKVTLSPSVKVISDSAFIGSGLQEIDLCEVEKIEDKAFWGCSLKSITLPKSLRSIGKNVFRFTKIKKVDDIRNESDLQLSDKVIDENA